MTDTFTLRNDPPGNKPMAQGILFLLDGAHSQPASLPGQRRIDNPPPDEPEPCFASRPVDPTAPSANRRKRCRHCIALVGSLDASGYCADCVREFADNQPCPSCFSFGCRGCNQGPRKSPEVRRV